MTFSILQVLRNRNRDHRGLRSLPKLAWGASNGAAAQRWGDKPQGHMLAPGTPTWKQSPHLAEHTSLSHSNRTSNSAIQVHAFESRSTWVSQECSSMPSFSRSSLRTLVLHCPEGSSERCPGLFTTSLCKAIHNVPITQVLILGFSKAY